MDASARWQRRCRCLAILFLGAAVLAAAAPAPAGAQEAGPRALTRGAATVSARQGAELVVPLGKSQLLRVDRAFDEVSVGSPEIADVVPLSKTLVYVLGKQPGATNITLTTADGGVIAVVDDSDLDNAPTGINHTSRNLLTGDGQPGEA